MDETIVAVDVQDWANAHGQAHAMSHPGAQRQHMSDAAYEAKVKAFPRTEKFYTRNDWEEDHVLAGTVLLTVAEHDVLVAQVDRLWKCFRQANDMAEEFEREWELTILERDQLRGELAAALRAQQMLQSVNAELHRQLGDRDEQLARVDSGGNMDARRNHRDSGGTKLLALAELDHRLGRGNAAMD